MKLFEGKTPAERNKTIAALALGAVALFFLARMFFGASPAPRTTSNANVKKTSVTSPTSVGADRNIPDESLIPPQPVVYHRAQLETSAAGRNIFAYYTPPVNPRPAASDMATPPPATPEPPPPLLLASLSKTNVYAKTGDFPLDVSGDKFTPQTRIYVNGQELPTQFKSPQQLSTTVPATLVMSPGARQVLVRTPDGQLFSNTATLNVTQPPGPEYTYVGIFGSRRYNDTAVLKNKKGELVSVQRGDLIGGRFRVTSISERTIEFTDQELKIKHTLPFVEGRTSTSDVRSNPPPRYVPPLQQPQPPKEEKPEEDEPDDEEP